MHQSDNGGAEVGAPAPVTKPPARKGRERPMTPSEYRRICKKLGISLAESARLLCVTPRQVSRWLDRNDPAPIPMLCIRVMRLLRDGILSPDALRGA